MKSELIAPCGMNCGLCIGYFREKNKCPGCNEDWSCNREYIKKCVLRNCEKRKKSGLKFCSGKCDEYPCRRLKNLDKRYRQRYDMSMLENLENLEKIGIGKFLDDEKERWIKGDKVFCVHKKIYFDL